ncbi:hypothetical protein QTP86_023233, partial [Hemibagrus guttatus]
MDPLEFLSHEELTRFFHCKKTEISCMEEPCTFLNQLRDHDLKVIKMKCKNKREDGVYQILDWLEKERGECVKQFWTCVFENHILKKYSVLQLLRNSFLDGSFRFYMELHDAKELSKNKQDSIQSREDQANDKKRKKSSEETEEREEPGPSPFSNRCQKKPAKKPMFTTSLKKGGKEDIPMWDLNKSQLPVTCGDKEGTLDRDKLARKGKSIQSQGQWFTANGFVRFARKGNGKRWKKKICCQNTPLQRLIESVSSVETEGSREDQDEERTLRQEEEDDDEEEDSQQVELSKFNDFALPVSCGSVSGVLYRSRFAGPLSKSIRTEEHWLSPEEFVMQELTLRERHWEKDILCHGKTFNYLVK